mmetsp:Transcript_113558/g.197264  ORF Transcript_113558/g.197264 Transcript_113558/m.197264 type:complete len:275 (-) Transcript_113558:1790-2614(-)
MFIIFWPHGSRSLGVTSKTCPSLSWIRDFQNRRSAKSFCGVCRRGSSMPLGSSVSKAMGKQRVRMRRMLPTTVYSVMVGLVTTISRRWMHLRIRLARLRGCFHLNSRPSVKLIAEHTSSQETAEPPGRNTTLQNCSWSSATGTWMSFMMANLSSDDGWPSVGGCSCATGGLTALTARLPPPMVRAVDVGASGCAVWSRVWIFMSWNRRTAWASHRGGAMLETKILFHAQRTIRSEIFSKLLNSFGLKGATLGMLLIRTRDRNSRISISDRFTPP